LIEQEPTQHSYSIGHLAHELGLAVVRDFHGTTQWSALVDTVAQRTRHTAYLLARSGTDSVCVHKAESRGALRVVPVEVGQRRPLGVGAGALALLSSFEPADITRIVKSIAPSLCHYAQLNADVIIQDALAAKQRGFAVSRGRVFDEVIGIGFLLPPTTAAQLAISIAAPASLMNADTIAQVATTIRTTIDSAIQQVKSAGGRKC
jgi:DNA-binding IclR family transcriptional regulator